MFTGHSHSSAEDSFGGPVIIEGARLLTPARWQVEEADIAALAIHIKGLSFLSSRTDDPSECISCSCSLMENRKCETGVDAAVFARFLILLTFHSYFF